MGEENIGIHSQKRQRYRCTVCGKSFSARAGTIWYRRRTDDDTISRVGTLVRHGCPVPAIKVAFGFQTQTVREWVEAAEAHAQALHQALVVQPRDQGQVQADEVQVKQYAGRAVTGTIHRLVHGRVRLFLTFALEHAGLSGAQHGLHRAAEWHLP